MSNDALPAKAPADDASPERPGRPRSKSTTSAPLCVRGVGFGGIDELQEKLDSTTVQWGLVRFQIGGGKFQRTKFVSLCCNGENCPSVARARLLTRTKEVLKLFGPVHANIEFSEISELTMESFLKRLMPLFDADDLDISNLHKEYVQWVQGALEEKRKSMRSDAGTEVVSVPTLSSDVPSDERKEDKERTIEAKEEVKGPSTLKEAKSDVKAPSSLEDALGLVQHGPLNWVLFEALKFGLHSSGSGGVEEMQSALDEDKVLFGLLRLSFNRALTKYVVIHWIGSETNPVKRGKGNARVDDAKQLIGKMVVIALTKTGRSKQDLELESIITDLKQIHTDMDLATMDLDGTSVEKYLSTLAEEQSPSSQAPEDATRAARTLTAPKEEPPAAMEAAQSISAASDPSGEALSEEVVKVAPDKVEDVKKADAMPEPADAIAEVCKPEGIYNWVLVSCQKA